MKKRKGLSMRQREMVHGYIFTAPWLIGFLVFFVWNLGYAVVYSLSKITILDEGGYSMTWVGLNNYRIALFENTAFNPALVNSITGMLINVPLIIFFSLMMALFLNRKFMMRGLVRAIFFLPVVMATTAITGTLTNVMTAMMGGVSAVSPDVALAQGSFNAMSIINLLANFGMPVQIAEYISTTIGRLYEVIRASGVQILIFLAALQAIPTSLYEVSQIEGATAYEAFWKITFPMVSPLILTNVIYTIVDTFSTSEVVTLAYNAAFGSRPDFGLSSAMSIISSVTTCLILLIVGYILSRNIFYQT